MLLPGTITCVQPVLAPTTSSARVAPRIAAIVALIGVPLAIVLAFTWAPISTIRLASAGAPVEYDFPQKIFYLHVPCAFAAYFGFFTGAWNALLYLIRDRPEYDVRSYVGIHVGMVFGTAVLVTGSIWARAAWGTWWSWGDRQLLVFLILYLFYGAWFMLRFSVDGERRRARVSAVLALLGVVLVPFSFVAIRIADTLIHPIVIDRQGLHMTTSMGVTFMISIVAFLSLCLWMMQLEATVKVRDLRRRASQLEAADA